MTGELSLPCAPISLILSPDADSMYLEDYPTYELVSLRESDLSPKLGVIFNVTAGY